MVCEHHFAIELLTQHHLGVTVTRQTPDITYYGAYIMDMVTGRIGTFLSKVTLMATGGIGAVYQTTTNPLVATGDGIAMVYRFWITCLITWSTWPCPGEWAAG